MIATVIPQAVILPAQKDGMTAWDLGWRGYLVVKSCDVLVSVD
jgi:hypothetical protein